MRRVLFLNYVSFFVFGFRNYRNLVILDCIVHIILVHGLSHLEVLLGIIKHIGKIKIV